jgi:hypothetical protein
VAAVAAVVLVASATRYGYFGDELYFLAAGRRLSFGYADQGPVLPLLAALGDTVAPGSLVALRLPAILLTVVAIVVSALVAREFGGGRGAQILTALGYATSPFLLMQAKNLSTNAIDSALWVLITWLVVRWVRTRRDGLLLAAAAVTALDMQVKWLIPFFWIAVVASSLVFGPRDLVRRPLLWAGGLIVLLVSVPSLFWQARHGWPQLGLGAVVREEQQYSGGPVTFVPLAVLLAGALGAVLLCYGLWALLRHESLRPYRFLGATTVLLLAVFLVSGGRVYYLAGMYGVVFAAGAVALAAAVRHAVIHALAGPRRDRPARERYRGRAEHRAVRRIRLDRTRGRGGDRAPLADPRRTGPLGGDHGELLAGGGIGPAGRETTTPGAQSLARVRIFRRTRRLGHHHGVCGR